jgi:branched-chain amino acid aminotransferase
VVEKLNVIWMDGRLVPWEDAKVHVLTHSLHYGLGAFEGIRSYATEDKQAVFRLKDHIRRLYDSCRIAGIEVPLESDALCTACKETLIANRLREGYVRPLIYLGAGAMGVYPADNPVGVAVAVWKWGPYLGAEATERGARTKISSFTRYHPNTMMTRGKFTGNYTALVLAKTEAKALGFDEAILLDPEGYVAEGAGENLFIVRDGEIQTTPLSVILSGITRATVMTIARDLGYTVREQRFTRDDLYIADEAFFTGTAVEVAPVREVDGREIGAGRPGPVTRAIQRMYSETVRGRVERYADWLDPFELDATPPRADERETPRPATIR